MRGPGLLPLACCQALPLNRPGKQLLHLGGILPLHADPLTVSLAPATLVVAPCCNRQTARVMVNSTKPYPTKSRLLPTPVGRITSLVAKGDRVLAQRVEEALQRGLPLDQLSANKHVIPPHMR